MCGSNRSLSFRLQISRPIFPENAIGKTMGRSKRAIVRFFAIRTLGKFLGPPLWRSPALVCDCFLNIRKRALDRPEKLHLSFRLIQDRTSYFGDDTLRTIGLYVKAISEIEHSSTQ